MMSHRSADNVCLQHAHTWLYKLTSKKKVIINKENMKLNVNNIVIIINML